MPRATDPQFPERIRLGKRVHDVINRMRKGQTLHAQAHSTDGTVYWLEPSGKSVGPVTALKIIALDTVEDLRDGLFDGGSQSYRYRSAK